YVARQLLPVILRPVNPLYAAQTIERSAPTFKNSLLNLLMFRSQRTPMPVIVYQSVERHAATSLRSAPVDTAVDRSGLIRVGYLLIGVFAVTALYMVLSPKDLLATVGRVVYPLADIRPPLRVTIDD